MYVENPCHHSVFTLISSIHLHVLLLYFLEFTCISYLTYDTHDWKTCCVFKISDLEAYAGGACCFSFCPFWVACETETLLKN